MGFQNLFQDPQALPIGQASMPKTGFAEQFKGKNPRLPPLRPQGPMVGYGQAMGAQQQGAPMQGINPAAMQFISQMMSQPGGMGQQGGLMNFGTPWEYGTPVNLPAVMGREAVIDYANPAGLSPQQIQQISQQQIQQPLAQQPFQEPIVGRQGSER